MEFSQTELKKIIHYDTSTGNFTWLINKNYNATANTLAGYIKPNKHRYIKIKNKEYSASRLAWFYLYGYFPKNDIDHINRNSLDNRISNLREISHQHNSINANVSKNNTSKVTGVSWCKKSKKWLARIRVNYVAYNIGFHNDFLEAVCHRLAAEQCLGWDYYNPLSTAYQYVKTRIRIK